MIKPRYLGDGVYAQMDNICREYVILTTDSHILENAQNTIYLEPDVIKRLKFFIADMEEDLNAPHRSS
jgi:hypothetical protein